MRADFREFAHNLDRLTERRRSEPIVIAVSGGSDSLALLHLMADPAKSRSLSLHAVTIDHNLRPEARSEALFVADICAGLGIPHNILAIDWPEGEVPSQARARRHRYRLLSGLARRMGARLVLTGHTHDDQLETFCLRRAAKSDDWGLAGMDVAAPLPVWSEGEGLFLFRPLLGTSRSALRDYLSARQVDWVEDPSNSDPRFERVRHREALAADSALRSDVSDRQSELQRARLAARACLRAWVDEELTWLPGGAVKLGLEALHGLQASLQYRLFSLLLPSVAGQETLPRKDRLEALLVRLSHVDAEVSVTLGGCRISTLDGEVLITPEVERPHIAPVEFPPGRHVWHGRIGVHWTGNAPLRLATLHARALPHSLKEASLPLKIRDFLPAILDEAGDVSSLPHKDEISGLLITDLAPVRFVNWLWPESEVFGEEYRPAESFSAISSPML